MAAAAGLDGADEPAIVTAGEALRQIARLPRPGQDTYTARDVIQRIVGNTAAMDVINAFLGQR